MNSGYFGSSFQIANTAANIAIDGASGFASIGLVHIFSNQIELSKVCLVNLLTTSKADFLNMDRNIISAFIANTSIAVPKPLSCIQGTFTAQINTINSLFTKIDNNITNPSPSLNCEPLFSDFKSFEIIWVNYINRLRDYATSMTIYILDSCQKSLQELCFIL
jgi:hypothetical protein